MNASDLDLIEAVARSSQIGAVRWRVDTILGLVALARKALDSPTPSAPLPGDGDGSSEVCQASNPKARR